MAETVTLKTIGVVRNELKEARRGPDVQQIVSEIVLDKSLADALEHLEDFTYVMVVYLAPRSANQDSMALKIYPHNDKNNPMVGIFATFTQDRPNPIGLAVAEVVERKDNILKVTKFGVVNGTHVIDIKPYVPRAYMRTDAKVGAWITG
jgi:tRNA-Thr(GGU) m(6)t(6)A37 methyltransferase TsaA